MAHINERIDHCVEVFIVHDHKVLLRWHDKYSIWLSIGGHIDPGEDLIEAAHREVKEEVGLSIEIIEASAQQFSDGGELLPRPRYVYSHMVNETHRHVAFVYFARTNDATIKSAEFEHEQNMECRWCSRQDLDAMKGELRENVYLFATEVLKVVQ